MSTSPLLSVVNIDVRYGQMTALRDVSVTVEKSEVVCVIGPNGAGKSTLLAAVAGGVALAKGSVSLGSDTISGKAPERIARMGVSLVPEGRHIFGSLTVAENLRLAGFFGGERAQRKDDLERVLGYFPRLRERLTFAAGKLSGGEQQMLAIGRALMTRANLMLVDEPSLGLAPKIIDQIYDILLDIRRAQGLTLLINEQSSNRILKHADRIYVLRGGRIQLEGRAADLADGVAIREAYFGFHDDARGDSEHD